MHDVSQVDIAVAVPQMKPHFQFDGPSPDDLVLAAQQQGRPAPGTLRMI
jgi:hypothetical protein